MKAMHKTKAGGAKHASMLKPSEKGTARPAKGKVMSKPGETRARMIQSPGMSRYEHGLKGKP